MGAVFGLMRGVLVALVVVTIVRATPLAQWEPWLASSGVQWLEMVFQGLRPVLPEQVIEFLRDLAARARPFAERDLADSLRVLNLTPGARKSVRTGAREVDQATKAADPLQAKILKLMP